MIYLDLMITFALIGLFSIGGGYAALPLIEEQVVLAHNWLSMNEFMDVLTISQMTPGPIALNAATFVGNKMGGVLGALCATIGVIIPSFIIVLCLAFLYYKYRNLNFMHTILKGLRVGVVALIATAGMTMIVQAFFINQIITIEMIDYLSIALFMIAIILLHKYKLNPIIVMLICGVIAIMMKQI